MATDIPRRLVAIVAADIAGYTRLMELDEAGTVAAWRRARADVIEPTVAKFQGRIVKLTGDGFLAEFPTVESAVRAALEMQQSFTEISANTPADRKIAFRMGVNVGDVWVDADDIYGAGVNVAARLEALAEPGGLCVSGAVYEAVKHKIAAQYEDIGLRSMKNVAEPIHAWRVQSRAPERDGQWSVVTAGSGQISLRPTVAWSLLSFVLVGMLAVVARIGDVTQVKASMLPVPPALLAEQAREILASAGHDAVRTDSAWWFVAELPSEESGPTANAPIRNIRFVYRQSPSYLVPQNLFQVVTQDDPGPSVAGMVSVILDAGGNLLRLNAVRVPVTEQEPVFSDWPGLFNEAGLDFHDFREIPPNRPAPSVPHERQIAWTQLDTAASPLFVTAATMGGKPVYFEASAQLPAAYLAPDPFRGSSAIEDAIRWLAVVLAFGAAAIMARYNLRRGEGDRTSALRLSLIVFACSVLTAILRAHHVPLAIEEAKFLFSITGWSVVWGIFTWLIYVGLEPHAQRIWPRALTSWRRLLSGRLRDSIVGRDVLVGIAVGVGLVAARFLFTDEPLPNDFSIRALDSLRSLSGFAHAVVLNIMDVPVTALAGLLFLLLLRAIFRNTWVAAGVLCLLFLPYVSGGTALQSWEHGAYTLFISIVVVVLLLSLGLVAYASSLLAQFFLTRFPLTLDTNAWYFGSSTLILLMIAALATYACVVALGPGMLSSESAARRTSQ